MLLGDRPIGKGVPVDRLDKACRALKQCHKSRSFDPLIVESKKTIILFAR